MLQGGKEHEENQETCGAILGDDVHNRFHSNERRTSIRGDCY